ncbi:BnaA09g28690D [Brassica napus]|uniref:BnaA09g28690D protein n=1 Tax=Brassica napus TaxID=3708 RepID=A0A078FNW5_BRANA|nr:BnaA09g28690D [Brassica napus]
MLTHKPRLDPGGDSCG